MKQPNLSTALSLFAANAPLTMSSLEIATLTGKRHDHVMDDIRKMMEELDLSAPDFSGVDNYAVGKGAQRTREIFNLPKRECFVLVSGYNIKLRAAIIDRWQELEGAAPKPMSQIDQVRLLLVTLEREEELKNLIAEGKYLSVKQLRSMYGWGTFSGKDLTALSDSEGYEVKQFGGDSGVRATSVNQPKLYHIEVVTSYLLEQWADFTESRRQKLIDSGHKFPFDVI